MIECVVRIVGLQAIPCQRTALSNAVGLYEHKRTQVLRILRLFLLKFECFD